MDNNLYFFKEGDHITILLTHVDEFDVISSSNDQIYRHKSDRRQHFSTKDLGQAKMYLEIEFDFAKNGITMYEHSYCNEILQEFHIVDCIPALTPLPVWATLLSESSDLHVM